MNHQRMTAIEPYIFWKLMSPTIHWPRNHSSSPLPSPIPLNRLYKGWGDLSWCVWADMPSDDALMLVHFFCSYGGYCWCWWQKVWLILKIALKIKRATPHEPLAVFCQHLLLITKAVPAILTWSYSDFLYRFLTLGPSNAVLRPRQEYLLLCEEWS